MLLSRSLKRDKSRLKWIVIFMIFARFVDMFWLIEPNFRDSAGDLHWGNGMLAYLTVPLRSLPSGALPIATSCSAARW